MSNKSVDSEEHHENNPQHRSNLQQQYNFSNTTITAEKIVMGYGNNMDEAAFPFEMNKEEFERAKNKPSVSRETTDGASSSTAPEREQTGSWKSLKTYIRSNANTVFTAYYAGHKIDCDGSGHWRKFQLKWDCKCVDTSTRTPVKCQNYKSQKGACEHALAELVRTMNKAKIYPLATDAADMVDGC